MIGVDPHKGSHTAVALGADEAMLSQASSGAPVLRTCLISTADPSRSTTGVPSAAGRGSPPGRRLRPCSQGSSRRSGLLRVPDARPGWRCLRACLARRAASASARKVPDRSRARAAKISGWIIVNSSFEAVASVITSR